LISPRSKDMAPVSAALIPGDKPSSVVTRSYFCRRLVTRNVSMSGNSRETKERDAKQLETCPQGLSPQVLRLVAANMLRRLVGFAPEEGVLRHPQKQAATRPQRPAHLLQDPLVLLDVPQHIEGADDVELRFEGDGSSVHLHQLRTRKPVSSEAQAGAEGLTPSQPHVWQGTPDPGQDPTGTAADLEKGSSQRKISPKRPDDQLGAAGEPEATLT